MKKHIVSLVVATTLLTACGGSENSTGIKTNPANVKGDVTRRDKGATNEEISTLTNNNTNFAIDVYKHLASNEQSNIVASPFSMSTAFAMLYAGANGNTADELKAAFYFDMPNESLHQTFNTIDQTIEDANSAEELSVSIVNSQWGEETYDFNNDYVNTLSEFYGADIKLTSFLSSPSQSRENINNWVEAETNSLIKDLMPQDAINVDTRLVLVNAVFFDGKWASPFPASNTEESAFTLLDGSIKNVPTMNQRLGLNLFSDGNETLIELPYKGEAFSMYLLHSPVSQFVDMEDDLSTHKLDQFIDNMEQTDVDLYLPKFSFDSKSDLAKVLKALGVKDAFDRNKADFSPINKRNEVELFVQAAVHQANISVNEEGTVAGAATGISVGIESMPMTLELNSPFIFFIRHNQTGALLFVGRVLDPLN